MKITEGESISHEDLGLILAEFFSQHSLTCIYTVLDDVCRAIRDASEPPLTGAALASMNAFIDVAHQMVPMAYMVDKLAMLAAEMPADPKLN